MNAPDVKVAQAKIDLIVDDVGANSALMIASLNVILAMREAGDTVGLIYSARRAQAYWRFIAASTRDLIAAESERHLPCGKGKARLERRRANGAANKSMLPGIEAMPGRKARKISRSGLALLSS